jgi:hypothetical protein
LSSSRERPIFLILISIHLCRREPIGVYYARLYVRGGNKWISLHTKVFSVAKLELHKHLSRNSALQDARAAVAVGKATVGDLATVYLEGVELNGAIKASSSAVLKTQ